MRTMITGFEFLNCPSEQSEQTHLPKSILRQVAEKYNMSIHDVITDRSHRVAKIRLEAMWQYRQEGLSYQQIGKLMGTTRQTVHKSLQKLQNL